MYLWYSPHPPVLTDATILGNVNIGLDMLEKTVFFSDKGDYIKGIGLNCMRTVNINYISCTPYKILLNPFTCSSMAQLGEKLRKLPRQRLKVSQII